MGVIIRNKFLATATDTLINSVGFTEHTVSLDMLESVARMRYCLQVVSELLQLRVNQQGGPQFLYGHVAHQLLNETRYHNISFVYLYCFLLSFPGMHVIMQSSILLTLLGR